MFDIEIDESFRVIQQGTSEGTQEKYKKDGYWYKLNQDGEEGLVECLASRLLTFSDLPEESYIVYADISVGKSCDSLIRSGYLCFR